MTISKLYEAMLRAPSDPDASYDYLEELVGRCPDCSGPLVRFERWNNACLRCYPVEVREGCGCPGLEGGTGRCGWHFNERGDAYERCPAYHRHPRRITGKNGIVREVYFRVEGLRLRRVDRLADEVAGKWG